MTWKVIVFIPSSITKMGKCFLFHFPRASQDYFGKKYDAKVDFEAKKEYQSSREDS